MDVCEVGEVIDKDSGTDVSLLGGLAATDWDEAKGWADQLIRADNFARCCGWSES